MSHIISSLENELGIVLLKRTRYGSVLTPEGEELFPVIEDAIAKYQKIKEKANSILNVDSGIIRIGTLSSISRNLLPPILDEFHVLHPNVELILKQGDYTSIVEWIKNGNVDFGFVNVESVGKLEKFPLQQGLYKAILPPTHRLAENSCVSLRDIANEPFILLDMGEYSECMEQFKKLGLYPNIKMTLHDDYSIMAMVEMGMGVSILPELVLERMNYNVEIRDTDPPISREMALVCKSKGVLSNAARQLIDLIESKIFDAV